MECNKEEAVRAKKLAEEKMRTGDYVGAHKFVTKAQRLFPDLENIPQLIAICDVHSSASKKLNGLDNWYAIIQVQPFADADTIRKQYRKLALLLHPDKNKFAGAEGAFKLVGEANRLLSDQIKRSQYDARYRSHSMYVAKHLNANSARHHAAASYAAENLSSVYTFWTCCKNCGQRYKYLKPYINTVMHCSFCKKSYIACNMGNEVPPSSSTASKKEFQDQGMYNTSRQNTSIGAESGSSAAQMDKNGAVRGKINKNQENLKRSAAKRKPKKDEGCIQNAAEGGKPRKGETGTNISTEIPEADVLKPQPQVKEPETSTAKSRPGLSALKKNQAAKKRTKTVEESSKSFEVNDSDVAGDKVDTNEYNKRKARKKPQGTYAERESDGDFVSPPTKKTKAGCEFESDFNTKQTTEDKKSPEFADSGASPAFSHAYIGKSKESVKPENEDILSAKNKGSEGCDGNEMDAASSSKIDKVENGYRANENPDTLHIAANQVWSISDARDGMPRKYVRVKKVLKAVVKLQITYLEPVQDKNDVNITVACGKFKNGKTEEVEDRSIFSGQMHHSCSNRVVFIYPRKGDIWAIFRDWNEEWNTSLEKHRLPYKYDFVEVVSDFNDEVGVGVAYLGKLKGFVSRFHWEAQQGVCQIQFSPKEILRFSHKVPAVKMTGKEKESVPAVSYELDRAALPKDVLEVDAVKMEMDSEILEGEADGPCPEAPKVEVKATPGPKTAPSPKKRRTPDEDNGVCSNLDGKGETSGSHNVSSCQVDQMSTPNKSRKSIEASDVVKLRKSPRLQTIPRQQRDEKKSDKQDNKMNTPKGLVTDTLGIRKSPNGTHQPEETHEGESSKKQRLNDELPTQLNGSTYESPETTPLSPTCKTPRRNAFDFKNHRSEEKFQPHQVWAVYSNYKGLPLEYVKIKKIETKPEFVLHGTYMELYPPSTEPVTRPRACGEFKLKKGRPKILPRAIFSHQVSPVPTKKNIVKIYPRLGEIWALYKNCDNTKEEHDIVEVVEEYGDGEIAKVVALTANGSNSLYIIQRKHGSNAGFIDIPKAEMSRFSHRIPAIRHEKKTTRLVGGYWELDPTAIPTPTLVLD